ncbi:putative toxin-antitoxin system toxin component, PIN family [Microgenomates group bacterium]|nr:putative toxin-antitoxin system toxin component, PIN family [Microgenomates group bacterium]
MLKVVLDTNVIVSAIVFGGKPELILNLITAEKIDGYISRFIIAETCGILRQKFKHTESEIEAIEETLKNAFSLIEPNFSISIVKDNPPDNKILACALAAKADYLISGDKKHILLLKKIKNIPILSPEQFLKLMV